MLRALDLFCGEGGVSVGLARAGFDVFGVDNSAERLGRYPYDHLRGDVLELLAAGLWRDFDYIHASPPCTGYSRGTAGVTGRLDRYDRLIAVVRALLIETGLPYTIENVEDAKSELRSPLVTCWTEFREPGSVLDDDGTPLWMRRHRLWESNVWLWGAGGCAHPIGMQCAGAYGGARRDKHEARHERHGGYVPSLPVMRELLGTPWMSQQGCQLAIPPDYAEYIGGQVAEHITEQVRADA